MRKDDLENEVIKLKIDREVRKEVKYRCIAFWSAVMAFTSAAGAWVSANIHAVKIGLRAFWDAWLSS